jgi:hypothetical protein
MTFPFPGAAIVSIGFKVPETKSRTVAGIHFGAAGDQTLWDCDPCRRVISLRSARVRVPRISTRPKEPRSTAKAPTSNRKMIRRTTTRAIGPIGALDSAFSVPRDISRHIICQSKYRHEPPENPGLRCVNSTQKACFSRPARFRGLKFVQ